MNFKEYASKIRTQAAAAANRIPTFDDMAKNDEYIHSEEFNVRGQPRPKNNEAVTVKKGDLDEASSLSSSWSLLDNRQPLHPAKSPVGVHSTGESQKTTPLITTQTPQDRHNVIELPISYSANTSISSGAPSGTQRRSSQSSIGSLPLLAVVANALEHTKSNAMPKDGYGSDGLSANDLASTVDDSDSSVSDDDDNDPILSMIQIEKRHKTRSTTHVGTRQKKSNKKTPGAKHNFLLDERIAETGTDDMESGILPPMPPNQTQAPKSEGFKGPFGGLVINFAKEQFERVTRRPDDNSALLRSTKEDQNPPIARGRYQQKRQSAKIPEEIHHQTESSNVLGEEDLAQLAKFKESSSETWCSTLAKTNIREYRHFGLIVVTLALALLVYYFQQVADDVT